MHEWTIRTTSRTQFVDITAEVAARARAIADGMAVVFVPHTTAGVTIQENADPDVVRDLILWCDRTIPKDFPGFRHAEGNSDSHLKASFFGSSVTIPVVGGVLRLGRWQGVYLCEFDGPRARTVQVQLMAS